VPIGGAWKVGYTPESPRAGCVVNKGGTPQNHQAQEGSLELNGYNCSSGETSVGMYKLKEATENSCSDLLASHQRKYNCSLAGMTTWRFSSR
jgi:hypothetical protein